MNRRVSRTGQMYEIIVLLAVLLFIVLFFSRAEGFVSESAGPSAAAEAAAPTATATEAVQTAQTAEVAAATPSELADVAMPSSFSSDSIPTPDDELSPRKLRSKKTQTLGLAQGNEYNKTAASKAAKAANACESPEYIRKDRIPCWACTLPMSTD